MKQYRWMIPVFLIGCVPLSHTNVGQSFDLVISPRFASRVQAILDPNTVASIATLDIVPYVETSPGVYSPISAVTGTATTLGAADVLKLSQASPSIDPNRPIVIRRLKPNKNYRVYARAYNLSSLLISQDNNSYVDVAVGADDAPGMAILPVSLVATPFSATAAVSVSTEGRFDYLRATLFQVSGGAQVGLFQTVRTSPVFSFGNLQGNTNYRLALEAYKLGSVFASTSLNIDINNDNMPSTQSVTLTIPYVTSTLAGAAGTTGSADGTGTNALFYGSHGNAVDMAGNIYIADYVNNNIRKVTTSGVVTTIAGQVGVAGSADGTGTSATFSGPRQVAVDGAGNVYVGDWENCTIRKITPAGVVSTIAGLAGALGSVDGTGSSARFSHPQGVVVDSSGNIFVADQSNHSIRKVTSSGVVTTLAGTLGAAGEVDGQGQAARFSEPVGIALDGAGNLYVTDSSGHTIRKVSPTGWVSTLAGAAGTTGNSNGTGAAALFNWPSSITLDPLGNAFVADNGNRLIRKITPAGGVTTIAGSPGVIGSTDGTGTAALFYKPNGIVMDSTGLLYVVELGNHTLRVLK